MSTKNTVILGICILLAFVGASAILTNGMLAFKSMERTVVVKGLAEREVEATTAIWPIRMTSAGNDLEGIYQSLEGQSQKVRDYLVGLGFPESEITLSTPQIVDKLAQSYGDNSPLRYSGSVTLTLYTKKVQTVISARQQLLQLAKQGVNLASEDYNARTEFLFTGLNELKPEMIEQATRNGREVAQRFAQDSDSVLGKIRRAQQGVFSIRDRDSTTPHIKKVRVVSTIEYYLTD